MYAPGEYRSERCRNWDYAVKAGDRIADEWPVANFAGGRYWLRTYGPNGFFREYAGGAGEPALTVSAGYGLASGNPDGSLVVTLTNTGAGSVDATLRDLSYGAAPTAVAVPAGATKTVRLAFASSANWYDLGITVAGADGWSRRLAGRCETGRTGSTDPLIGRKRGRAFRTE